MTNRFEFKEIINHIGLPEGKQIHDNLTGERGLSIEELIDIANEQDQQIKELEKTNKDYDNAINEIADILMEAYEHGISNPYLKRIGKVKVENR